MADFRRKIQPQYRAGIEPGDICGANKASVLYPRMRAENFGPLFKQQYFFLHLNLSRDKGYTLLPKIAIYTNTFS